MLISLIRTLLIYVIIIVAVRIMGKRQISQLQTTELVVTLLISDLAVIPMQDSGQPLTSGLIPIFVLVACEIIASVLMLKSGKLRKAICGKPIVVISNGTIVQQELKELRMSTEDLFEALRQKDIFSLEEVKFAIIETNGVMSVVKKEPFEPVRMKDLNIKTEDEGIEVVVISDGDMCKDSLTLCNRTEGWVEDVLKKENTKQRDVFVMTANAPGKYTIIKKESP